MTSPDRFNTVPINPKYCNMITAKTPPPHVWVGQLLHFICLAILVAISGIAWTGLGKPYPFVFWTAMLFPVAHQVFVWLAWRLELQSAVTSKTIGFAGYLIIFFVLFFGRFVALAALAWMDRGSLGLPMTIHMITTIVLALPGIYAMYSVHRFFGMVRAAGADHFDSRYRTMALVRQGIFRFTSNGMYAYAFLLFWAIAIGFNSASAIVVAAFSHAYIWIHYFATEKPDMDYLYSSS